MSIEDAQEFIAKQKLVIEERSPGDDRLRDETKFMLEVLEVENMVKPQTDDQLELDKKVQQQTDDQDPTS